MGSKPSSLPGKGTAAFLALESKGATNEKGFDLVVLFVRSDHATFGSDQRGVRHSRDQPFAIPGPACCGQLLRIRLGGCCVPSGATDESICFRLSRQCFGGAPPINLIARYDDRQP